MNTPFTPPLPPHRAGLWFAARQGVVLRGLVVIAPVGLTIWLILDAVIRLDPTAIVLPMVPFGLSSCLNRTEQTYFGLDLPQKSTRARQSVIQIFCCHLIVGWLGPKGIKIGRSFMPLLQKPLWKRTTPLSHDPIPASNKSLETIFAQSRSAALNTRVHDRISA